MREEMTEHLGGVDLDGRHVGDRLYLQVVVLQLVANNVVFRQNHDCNEHNHLHARCIHNANSTGDVWQVQTTWRTLYDDVGPGLGAEATVERVELAREDEALLHQATDNVERLPPHLRHLSGGDALLTLRVAVLGLHLPATVNASPNVRRDFILITILYYVN